MFTLLFLWLSSGYIRMACRHDNALGWTVPLRTEQFDYNAYPIAMASFLL